MAAIAAVLWSSSNLFRVFLLLSTVTSEENTTTFDFNTTVFNDSNVTFDAAENDSSTQPTEEDTTSPTPTLSSTEEPILLTPFPEPLSISGHLPAPVTSVHRLCPCDEHRQMCDINCCCDKDCGEEVALFTTCSIETVSENKQLCSPNVASYFLQRTIEGFSEIQSSVREEMNYDVFCIQSQNRVDAFSHPSPALSTEGNFDSLFKQFTRFIFGCNERNGDLSAAELQASSTYQYGDVMVAAAQGGQREVFMLPAPGVTAYCVDNSPAAFLKDQSSWCSRQLVLVQDCSSLPALSLDTYTTIQLLSGRNKDAAVVPVEVASLVLQSVDGTQSELQISGNGNFSPVLLSPTLCSYVVLKVIYTVRYRPPGEITNVTVALVLGFVSGAMLTLEQEFHIVFVQEDQEEVAVPFSGNPGYMLGLPLVSGTKVADSISRSMDPRDTLSLLYSSQDQDCLRGRHQRSPVLFGVDSASGCTLRLEDAANCSQISQVLLDILRGPNYPQYVASFGNSPLDSPLHWVQVRSNFNSGEAQSCSVPLSLHLEIEWTKYGSLVNPQAQIVSIREIIQTNSSTLALLSAGSPVLSVSSFVSFKSVSAPARPGYRAMPTIDAKLPTDFFFPFI